MNSHKFDKDYFENGIATAKSLYENYQWMPSVSLPIANTIKKLYPNKSILDFGTAKGFLVYALTLLSVEVYGYDISKYALDNCKKEIQKLLFNDKTKIPNVDVVFSKDVFEHLEYANVDDELKWLASICKEMMCIIPFGENGKYRIKEYGFDITHIIKENEDWWIKKFNLAGFQLKEFYYKFEDLKSNWYSHDEFGNGIFFLEKI